MAINLEDHAVFIDRLQMDMVPLSIAKQAVQQALESNPSLDEAMEQLNKAMSDMTKNFREND
jgi:hypothetical protein